MILHRSLKSHLLRAGIDDETTAPESASWRRLIDLVNSFYEQSEADRHRLSRSGEEIASLHADLANERYKLHAVATSLPLGVGAVAPDGTILFLNPEGERLLGYAEEELERVSILSLVEPEIKRTLEELVGSGKAFSSKDHGLRCRDGSFLAVTLHLNPMLRDGRLLGAVIVLDPSEDRPSKLAGEALKGPLSGLLNALGDLAHRPLPDDQRRLAEIACGYANLLQAAVNGTSPSEPTLELAGMRILVVGPVGATLLGVRMRLADCGACLAEASDVSLALEMLHEASERNRPFDAVLSEQPVEAPVNVVALSELPRPLHQADVLSALQAGGHSFKTDVLPAVPEQPTGMRVCVVERAGATALLEECVTDLNFEFLLAGDTGEAWEIYAEEPVDLLVAGWDPQAEELCRKLREQDRQTALLFLTADPKQAKAARKLGADATLSEPVDADELKRVLRKLEREKVRKRVAADV